MKQKNMCNKKSDPHCWGSLDLFAEARAVTSYAFYTTDNVRRSFGRDDQTGMSNLRIGSLDMDFQLKLINVKTLNDDRFTRRRLCTKDPKSECMRKFLRL